MEVWSNNEEKDLMVKQEKQCARMGKTQLLNAWNIPLITHSLSVAVTVPARPLNYIITVCLPALVV